MTSPRPNPQDIERRFLESGEHPQIERGMKYIKERKNRGSRR
jgi:hypothetical protein